MLEDPVPQVPVTPILPLHIPTLADSTPNPDANSGPDPTNQCPCSDCLTYHSLATDLLNELRSVKNLTSGMVESTLNNLDITSHWTSGFYLFHEKVQLKEMDQGAINVDGIGPGFQMQQKSQHMCNIAQKALNQLKDMPPTSYKWTWGETLTQDDILDLSSGPSHWVHSGYQVSLRDGPIQGIPSSTNTAPTGMADTNLPLPHCRVSNPFISLS